MRFKLLGLVAATTLASVASYALSPTREEAFLCGGTHVVVGTVIEARRVEWGKDLENTCRNQTWHCPSSSTCQNIPQPIYLKIRVNDVLGVTTKKTLPIPEPYTGVSMKTVLAG